MIIAIVRAKILKGKEEELRKVANILQNDYAPEEVGCEQYECFIDGDDFIVLERWSSQADLNTHLGQEHMKTYFPQLKACIEKGELNIQVIKPENVEAIVA